MDERIFRLLKGQASPAEEERVNAWRAASRENEDQYRLLVAILAEYSDQERQRALVDPPSLAEIGARASWSSMPASAAQPWAPRLRRFSLIGVAAAALVLVGLALAQLVERENVEFGAEVFVTGKAERASIELRDGTVVRLGPGSRLEVARGREQREVFLTGRAYFAVSKVNGRPFAIHTAAGQVNVLGTRFDLEARDQDLQIVVVEGRVAVASQQRPYAEVAAGEMYRVMKGKELSIVPVPDVLRFVEWTGDFLAFHSTPVSEVAREIERRYDVRIEIQDSVVAKRVVTAWFADRPLADVLRVVCLAVAAYCTTDEDVVRITSADRI